MMNTESLISGALSGGIITVAWNLYNRRHEYDYDHKKYILKKRQIAYEKMESLLLRLQVRNVDASDKKIFHNIFYDTKRPSVDALMEFGTDLNDLMGYSIWMTDKLISCLAELNALINSCIIKLPPTFEYHKSISEGKQIFDQIEASRIKLFYQYLTDIKKLKNINSFLRNKVMV
ncbi:MAG: hypothetical protein JST02_01080 [Bacteroidetes bacterium]|nr:hypothetical protein [Bacteroidota bacterium]